MGSFWAPRLNAVFIHVPKTGGTSVTVALDDYFIPWSSDGLIRWDKTIIPTAVNPTLARRCFDYGHSHAVDIRRYLGSDIFDRAFSFGFVRDPIEHTISGYRAARRPAEQTIDGWLDDLEKDPIEHLAYSQWPYLTADDHIIVSYVGHYAKFQLHFDEVCDRLHIARRALPHANISQLPAPDLPKALEIRIRDMFYRDYNIFNERLGR